MSLSAPRNLFGVHSVSPYSRTDGSFYGMLRVLEGSSLAMSGQIVELMGGSSKFSWAAEEADIKADLSLKTHEYPDFLFTLFLGATPTANAGEALGSVTTLTNIKGTTIKATTGFASIGVKSGSEASLKFGKYVVIAADTTHVNVFFSSDADIARGTAGTYQSDALKVNASPLVCTQSMGTDIPNFGLTLTGDSGTIALVAGDSATFHVRPENSKSMNVVIGGQSNFFPEFGAIIMAQKRGNQELFEVDAYRCKGAGFPLGFDRAKFSTSDIKCSLLYDSAQDGVFAINAVSPL